jgi:hypothetical protein
MNRSTPTANVLRLLLGFALGLVLTACSTQPKASLLPALRLHPQYEDAMRCAPDFTSTAMKAIANLEAAAK